MYIVFIHALPHPDEKLSDHCYDQPITSCIVVSTEIGKIPVSDQRALEIQYSYLIGISC